MIENLKLVIWDLDETFWKGTLSEEEVCVPEKHLELVRHMTDCGIVNSICSKNNLEDAENELKKNGIWDYFVFTSIDWTPKGERIKNLISDMALRAVNVLFIDDNEGNLHEALYYNKGLQVLNAADIEELVEYVEGCEAKDLEHARLKQYRVLEKKREERKHSSSNEEFLAGSDIQVYIDSSCKNIQRIAELVARSNQLNYTKLRMSENEIAALVSDSDNKSGAIYVKDRFGDYGMVGFYCVNIETNKAIHYLFSCRTLGMGIEQWVYQKLGYPKIDIMLPVTAELKNEEIVTWINEVQDFNSYEAYGKASDKEKKICKKQDYRKKCRILLKGPCDMFALQPFLGGVDISTEFNHVNDEGITISSHNHTCHIKESVTLQKEVVTEILNDCPFLDESAFETELFTDKYEIAFLSILTDCLQGVYRHREKGWLINIGSVNLPITDEQLIKGYEDGLNGYMPPVGFSNRFSEKYEFIGMLSPDDIVSNIEFIRNHMNKSTLLVLMLGSEISYEMDKPDMKGAEQRHKIVNDAIRRRFEGSSGVKLISFTKHIRGQESFLDSTDHLTKETFHDIAQDMTEIINSYRGDSRAIVKKAGSPGYIFAKGVRKFTKIIGKNNYQ